MRAALILAILLSSNLVHAQLANDQAAKYAQRVTGITLREADLLTLNSGTEDAFFERLFQREEFKLYRLPVFVSRLSNEESDPFQDSDDFQMSMAIAIRDNLDLRQIFTRPYVLTYGNQQMSPNLSPAIFTMNSVRPISETQIDFNAASYPSLTVSDGIYMDGVFSTSGFGKRFLAGGTNRRTVRAIYDIFLCAPIESWKNPLLENYYIGKDVTRHPGDSTATFTEKCAGCHAPMDAQRGAFAYYSYDTGLNATTKLDQVESKYTQNSDVYPEGTFTTTDESWENLLVTSTDQKRFGWRTATSGEGVLSFADMVVNSVAFQNCMTRKALKNFCDLKDNEVQAALGTKEFAKLASSLRSNGYKMKTLIKNIVKSDLCLNR